MISMTLANMNAILGIIASVLAIITSIVALRKFAPGWHKPVIAWVLLVSPAALAIVGGVALSYNAVAAGAMFFVVFALQAISFGRDNSPMSRSSVLWFGLACAMFATNICIATLAYFLPKVLNLIEGNLALTKALAEAMKKIH
jgi:hypothetical protein